MTGLKQSSVKLSKTVFPAGLPLGRILGASRLHTQQQGFSLLKAKSPAALPRHAQDSDFEILNVGAARWGFENRHPLHLEHSQPTRLSAPSVWKTSACRFLCPEPVLANDHFPSQQTDQQNARVSQALPRLGTSLRCAKRTFCAIYI